MDWQKFYASDSIVYGLKETINNLRMALYSMLILMCQMLVGFVVVALPTFVFALWKMPDLRSSAIQLRAALSSGSYSAVQSVIRDGHISQMPQSVIIACSIAFFMLFVLFSMFMAGYIRMLLKFHDAGSANLRELFMGWHRGPRLLVGGTIFVLGIALGLLLFVVPGIYIMVHGILFPFFIVDKNVGVIEAFKRSFNATRGYGWQIGALFLAAFILNLNPMIFIFAGFTKLLMSIHAYRRLTA